MKLPASVAAAALFGLAASAKNPEAQVYILQPKLQHLPETPALPKELAHKILLQRISSDRLRIDLGDIPRTIDNDAAVNYLARFGKNPAPLFAEDESTQASQLVVILEGVTASQASSVQEKLAERAAFTISDPPSAAANTKLLSVFDKLEATAGSKCGISLAINPADSQCWRGPSLVLKYDLQTSPETLQTLINDLARAEKFVSSGDIELALVLLPEWSRKSRLDSWGTAAVASDDRRRRTGYETETVLADDALRKRPTSQPAASLPLARSKPQPIQRCFTSEEACKSATNSCSGHGECRDKYARGGAPQKGDPEARDDKDDKKPAQCWRCHCMATENTEGGKNGSVTHWGGNICQKEDISVQFWLIVSITIALVGAVTFAIGLLFGVGGEQLPGVIGAGVSKGK